MIGEIRKAILPFYDQNAQRMAFKSRPVLILAQADTKDYVTLPISSVTRRQNLHTVYDIEVDPTQYPKLNLTKRSYVRTHKQTITNLASFRDIYANLKQEYPGLFLDILSTWESFQADVSSQALS